MTVSTISTEPGSVLTIEAGTVENKTVKANGSSIYPYAIDILTNGSLGDVTVNIKGGTVWSDYMAIRQFNNGEQCKNTLNVSGGYIYGAKRAIQVHMDNNAAYTNITAGTVEGGDYALCFLTTSENLSVSGGHFIGGIYSGVNGIITGGTYTEAPWDDYLAPGYEVDYDTTNRVFIIVTSMVASVNGVDYPTVQEAVNAADKGDTVFLKNNVVLTEKVTIPEGANITLNLMGYTLNGSILAKNVEAIGQ